MNSLFRRYNSVSHFLRAFVIGVVLMCACSGVFGQELVSTGTKTIKDAGNYYLNGDVSITTLEIENNSGSIVIDLQGHTLTIGTLRIGYYNLFTSYKGNVIFKDSSAEGTGIVNVTDINATAWNVSKQMEIQSPVQMNVSGKFDSNSNNSSSSLAVTGTGTLNVTGTITNSDRLNISDISTNGNVLGIIGAASYVWTGTNGTSWTDTGNWSDGVVPVSDSAVVIPDVTNKPAAGNIAVKSLKLESGAELTAGNITVTAGIESEGTISSSGAVSVTGSFINSGAFSSTGVLTVTEDFFNEGSIDAGSVSVSGDSYVKGTISTATGNGDQTFNGIFVLNGNTVIDAGTGTVTFDSTIDSDAAASYYNLSITAADIKCKAAVGGTNNLGVLSFTGNYEGVSLSPITCSGALTFGGNATVRGTISAASVSVTRDISFGGATESVTTTGNQTYSGVTSLLKTGDTPISLVSTGAGTVTFGGQLQNNNDGTSTAGVSVGTAANKTKAVFAQIGGTNPVGSVTVNGNAEFNGTVSAATVYVSGTASISGNVTTSGIISSISSPATVSQYYGGNVTLSGAVDFIAGTNTVFFNANLTGASAAVNFGNASNATAALFSNSVSAVTDVSVFGNFEIKDNATLKTFVCTGALICKKKVILRCSLEAGSLDFGGDFIVGVSAPSVTTTGNQTYAKVAVNRNTNADVFVITAGGDVNFTSTVDAYSEITSNLEITAAKTVFTGKVGASKIIGKLTVNGPVSIGANVTSAGEQKFDGAVELTANVVLLAGTTGGAETVSFLSTVDSAAASNYSLTLGNGTASGKIPSNVSFAGITGGTNSVGSVTVYGNAEFKNSFTASSVNVSGTSSFASNVTTTGNQTYTGTSIIKDDINFVAGTTTTAATVKFSSAINSASSESHAVTIGNGTGSGDVASNAVFAAASGGTDAFTSVTVYGKSTVTGGIASSGNQTYAGLVTLASDASFESASGTLTFGQASAASALSCSSYDLELKGNAAIYGANTFNKLTVDNSSYGSDTSVVFEGGKKQSIKEISVKGNSSGPEYVTLSSSDSNKWLAYFSGTAPTAASFEYTKIENGESVNAAGTADVELRIVPSSVTVQDSNIASPTSVAWFIKAYFWTGNADDADWETPANWSYTDPAVSVTAVMEYPSYTDGKSEITIATVTGKKDLDFASGIGAGAEKNISVKSLSVPSGKRIAIGDCTVNAVSSMAIAGTVALYGSQTTYPLTKGVVPASIAGTASWDNGSTIEYYGTAGTVALPVTDVLYTSKAGGVKSYENLKVSKISGVLSFENEVNAVSFADNATSTGVFKNNVTVSGASNLEFKGNWTFGDKTSAADQTVTVKTTNASAAIVVSGTVEVCANENAKKAGLTLTSGKSSVVNNGTLTAGNGTLSINGAYSGTGTLTASSADTIFDGNVDLSSGRFVHNSGTVSIVMKSSDYSRELKPRNDGVEKTTFKNLIIGSSATKSSSKFMSFSNDLYVDGNFTNYYLTTTSKPCYFKGNIKVEEIFSVGADTYFEGTGLQTVSGSATSITFKNLYCRNTFEDANPDNPSGLLLARNANVSVDLSVDAACFLTVGSEKTLEITKNISNNGTIRLLNKAVLTAGGNFVNGSSFNAGTGTSISVSGNFVNNGTFACGTSTVEFKGSGDSEISGDATFYNFKCVAAGKKIYFAPGSTQTVTNNFTITGTAVTPTEDYSKYISLLSKTQDSEWNIDCTGATVSVLRAKLQDSNNISVVSPLPSATDRVLSAETSRDHGNNTKWNFPGMIYVWTGASGSAWHNKENWNPKSIPGNDSYVEIHDVSLASNVYPEGDSAIVVAKLSIDEACSLDLNGSDITVSGTAASSYENKGTIKTNGTETVSLTATGTKDGAGASCEQGTWSYYGGTIKTITNLSYNNIDVTAAASVTGTISAAEFKCSAGGIITCAANAVINAPVVLAAEPATYSFDNAGNTLSFEKTVTTVTEADGTQYSLKLDGAGLVSFKAALSAGEILSNSPLSMAGIQVKSKGAQTYQSSVILSSTTADSAFSVTQASSQIVFKDSLSGNASAKSVSFGSSSDTSDTKTVRFEGDVSSLLKLDSYYKVEIDSSANRSVTAATGIVFNKKMVLEGNNTVSLAATNAASGSISIKGAVSAKTGDSPSLSISAKNTQLGTAASSVTVSGLNEFSANGTFTAYATEISTTGNQSYANFLLGNNIAFKTESTAGDVKTVAFSGTVNGAYSFTAGSTTDCTKTVFGGIVGGANPLTFIKNYGETDINATGITTSGNQYYYGEFVLGSASTVNSTGGKVQFDSSITGSSYDFAVHSPVFISGDSGISVKSFTVGTSASSKNLVVSAVSAGTAKNITVSCPVVVYGTFALLNGNLTFAGTASLRGTADLLFLNTGSSGTLSALYKDDATGKVWRSNAENVFKYRGSFAFPSALPDGTAVSTTVFVSSVSGLEEKTLQADKNFYCNGVDFSAVSAWNLKAAANDAASSGFAEIFNAGISYCNYSSSNGGTSYLSAAEATDGGNNSNVWFSYPVISYAKTVYDNVLEVAFADSLTGNAIKIENSEDEIWSDIAGSSTFVTYGQNSSLKIEFEGSYTDKECTEKTTGKGDISVFYLKTKENYNWNTDATGISGGDSQSTDMSGTHRTAVPFLNIVRAISGQYKGLRDQHKNRIASYNSAVLDLSSASSSAGAAFTATADECRPVLLAVRLGQELHTDPGVAVQPCYDAHNFIEFQYSEEIIADGNTSSAQNIRSSSTFAGLTNDGSGVKAAGIAAFASGKISCGSVAGGPGDVTVHSIYRNFPETISAGEVPQTHRFRLGIAAYLNQTAAVNPSGFNYWDGYIDSANTNLVSGLVTQISSGASNINDNLKDSAGNSLLISGTENHSIPVVSVASDVSEDQYYTSWADTVYGNWDLSAPEFAIYRSALSEEIVSERYEIIGACETDGSALNRIEFHLFDNTENFQPSAMWYSQIGWTSSTQELFLPYSYGADVFGGARPFEYTSTSDSGRATSGGIRYSTLYNKSSSFKYGTGSTPDTNFKVSNIKAGAVSSVYFPQTGSKRDTGSEDSLYFSIDLPDGSALPLKTTFSISYDGNGFITDLAGNLLYSKEISSIDRVSPRFNISSAKVKDNKLYLVFNKEMNIKEVTLSYKNAARGTVTGCFADSLRFIQIPSSGHTFDAATDVVSDLYILREVAPVVAYRASNATGLIFTLNRSVTLEDVRNYYVQCYSTEPGEFVDPVSGLTNVNVTYVMDTSKNYMTHGEAHALSDFAVGVVNPIYAYDDRQTDEGYNLSIDQYKNGSYAVHDWNAEQKNFGTLMSEHDVFVVASLEEGEADSDDNLPKGAVMYLDNKPDANSVSTEYNKNLSQNLRIWLPSQVVSGGSVSPVKEIPAISPAVNSGTLAVTGKIDSKQAKFDLDWDVLSAAGYASGNQVSFLFGLSDDSGIPERICHAPEYDEVTGIYTLDMQPLFALRLKNPSDVTSLDLWSFRLKGITLQRGNVTILNNVINASQGESTTIQVNMASEGSLSVAVMTLDGNIVQYLQHGTASAGEHHYVWNGTTKSGKKVARGLYFVRVFGSGIDETRKVMVVKD